MQLACLDGVVMPAEHARIPVTDEGLLRGDGVFEVLKLYAGRPFALEDHLERMGRSGENLRLPVDLTAVRADVTRLLDEAGPVDALLRIVVTRAGHRVLLTEPLPEHPPTLRLASVTYSPPRILDGVKSLSYGGNMLATRIAKERGGDEALLVTPHGRVLEGPTSSLFWAEGDTLLTPPLDDHILASITRARVIEETAAREEACPMERLLAADEVFLASTTREIHPVARVDDTEFATDGPVTATAAMALRERIERELSASVS
jgi:branched-chain amino acid aminotransferase